jgi:hypothetical protein
VPKNKIPLLLKKVYKTNLFKMTHQTASHSPSAINTVEKLEAIRQRGEIPLSERDGHNTSKDLVVTVTLTLP